MARTLEMCKAVATRLMAEIAVAIGSGAHKRPRFEGFRLTSDIKSEFERALSEMEQGKLDEAYAQLEGVFEHLQNKQVVYLRRPATFDKLSRSLAGIVGQGVKSSLLDPVRAKIIALEAYVQGHVDLYAASCAYWNIVDEANAILSAWKVQENKRVAAERTRNDLAATRAREAQQTQCAVVAEEFRHQLDLVA